MSDKPIIYIYIGGVTDQRLGKDHDFSISLGDPQNVQVLDIFLTMEINVFRGARKKSVPLIRQVR
jgi:hypothetical protein